MAGARKLEEEEAALGLESSGWVDGEMIVGLTRVVGSGSGRNDSRVVSCSLIYLGDMPHGVFNLRSSSSKVVLNLVKICIKN